MAKAAATGGHLCQLLFLFFLLSCLGSSLPTDTQTLSCNFSVKSRTTNGEAWYNRQCSVDKEIFLQDDNDNKDVPLGDEGKKINATKECADLSQKLKDITEELRKQLLLMKEEAVLTREPHILQVTTESQYREGQVIVAPCIFTLDGQYLIYFYPKNKTWAVTHDQIRVITEKLENNGDLAKDLSLFTMAYSGGCLKKLKTQRKETSSSTPNLISTQLQTTMDASQPLSPGQLPNNNSSSSNSSSSSSSSILAGLISIIIFFINYTLL